MIAAQGYLADEDFDNDVVRGVLRRVAAIDIVRVQDEGLSGEEDPLVLEWAAQHDRIVLTHDVKTMPRHACARVSAGLRMPGVCVVPQLLPIGRAIEELLTVIECSIREDWENQVRYLPL